MGSVAHPAVLPLVGLGEGAEEIAAVLVDLVADGMHDRQLLALLDVQLVVQGGEVLDKIAQRPPLQVVRHLRRLRMAGLCPRIIASSTIRCTIFFSSSVNDSYCFAKISSNSS